MRCLQYVLYSFASELKLQAPRTPYNVTYDHRALIIDGKRELLISGSVHYPRSSPGMWPLILKRSKEAGINMIETYVFWNLHQPNSDQEFYFEGNADLFTFLDLCQVCKVTGFAEISICYFLEGN